MAVSQYQVRELWTRRLGSANLELDIDVVTTSALLTVLYGLIWACTTKQYKLII